MKRVSTDEKTLTRFLLGDLPEAEREEIEASLIFDAELRDQITAVEFDLVDDYVRGRLKGAELERFESYYLASSPNRERVRLARELPDLQREHRSQAAPAPTSGAAATPEAPGLRRSLLSFIASLRPAAPYAFAGLLAVVALVVGWLLLGRNAGSHGGGGQIARVEQERTPSAAVTPAVAQTPPEPPGATPAPPPANVSEQPTPTPPSVPAPRPGREGGDGAAARRPSVVALALAPGLSRGSGSANTLVVPPGTDFVRLEVGLPRQDYKTLRAEVQTVEGRKVWSGRVRRAGRAPDGRRASVNIPARLLEEDDYLLTITGAAAGEEEGKVESFYFTALRR